MRFHLDFLIQDVPEKESRMMKEERIERKQMSESKTATEKEQEKLLREMQNFGIGKRINKAEVNQRWP